MPDLPIYNAKQNIKATTSAPLRNEAAESFQQDQKVIGAMQQVAQKWSDANDVMQYTEAKAKHGLAVADIQARADADPDFKNSEKYSKELALIRKDALTGISNQAVASKAGLEFDYDTKIAEIKIGSQFQKKQVAYNQVMVKKNLDTLLQSKLSALTPAEAQQHDMKINALINDNVQAGVLTHEQAAGLLKDAQETSVKYQIYADNSTQEKDSTLLKELKDPKGKYGFLSPDVRLKMVEENQRRIFQNNQTFKRETEVSRDNRFTDVFTKANEGTLTLNDLDAEMKIPEEAGGIPKKQLLDIRRSLQSRIKTDLEMVVENNDKAGEYLRFVDNFISDETDRQKGREAIVNAFKDNVLSPKEASLLNKLKRETEGVEQLKSREAFMGTVVPFKNAINSINDFFTGKKNFTETDKAIAIKTLLNSTADGTSPIDVAQTVIQEAVIRKNPNILNLSEEGQLVQDDSGQIRMMNNKGEVSEVAQKTSESKK